MHWETDGWREISLESKGEGGRRGGESVGGRSRIVEKLKWRLALESLAARGGESSVTNLLILNPRLKTP